MLTGGVSFAVVGTAGVTGRPVSVTKLGLVVFGGSLTKVVTLSCWPGLFCGLAGAACLGGSGGGPLRVGEVAICDAAMGPTLGGEAMAPGVGMAEVGPVTFERACVPAGGGLATEESITTTLPGPGTFTLGSWVVGALIRPVVPLEGSGGWGGFDS